MYAVSDLGCPARAMITPTPMNANGIESMIVKGCSQFSNSAAMIMKISRPASAMAQ